MAIEFVSNIEDQIVKLVAASIESAVHTDEELVHPHVLLVSSAESLVQSYGVRQFWSPLGEINAAFA